MLIEIMLTSPTGPYNAQRLLAESPERLDRRNMLLSRRKILTDGLQHVKKYEAQNASAPIPPSRSNYQRASVSTPQDEEMDGDRAHSLTLRYMSRPAV